MNVWNKSPIKYLFFLSTGLEFKLKKWEKKQEKKNNKPKWVNQQNQMLLLTGTLSAAPHGDWDVAVFGWTPWKSQQEKTGMCDYFKMSVNGFCGQLGTQTDKKCNYINFCLHHNHTRTLYINQSYFICICNSVNFLLIIKKEQNVSNSAITNEKQLKINFKK